MTIDPSNARAAGGHALIVTGGPLPRGLGPLPDVDLVIAADEGIDNARRLGLSIDLLVGDLDSCSDGAEAIARVVERHPVDKDETDLELALSAALRAGATSATVVVTVGGRADHALGNLLVLAGDQWSALRIDVQIDGARAWVVRDQVRIDGTADDLISLLAVGGAATGVTTAGLAWPLDGAVLKPGVGLGLSNQMTGAAAEVTVGSGAVVVIAPSGSTD